MARKIFDQSRKLRERLAAPLVLAVFLSASSNATEIRYLSNDMQFYGNGSWVSMNIADTTVGCGGSNPGEIRLNTGSSPNRVEFCDGTTWRRMDHEVTTDTCSTAGEIEFQSLFSVIRYCNGTNWVKTSVTSATKTYYITSGSTWVVPADWTNTENTIEVIGGGGGDECEGDGGGGGAYSKVFNVTLTPGQTVGVNVGAGGVGGVVGGDTWFCTSTSNCASLAGSAVVVGAQGGTDGWNGSWGGMGGAAVNGVGTIRYSGGRGGSWAAAGGGSENGGGGGGAGGPHGNGANGGSGSDSSVRGGGGGGGGGGSAGVAGGAGGNNYLGFGSGALSTSGTVGGGGGGGVCPADTDGGNGGSGWEWNAFQGSGGGGGGFAWDGGSCGTGGGSGGFYGGGAGSCASIDNKGGAPGVIVIKYTPGPDSNPDFFDFIDVYEAATSTSYQVSATMTGFDVSPLTVNVTGGDAEVRKNGVGAWGGSIAVNPGDILNLRMTSSGSPSTPITATVAVGSQSVDWLVSTGTGPTFHRFVLSSTAMPDGNLGGLAGANATCLTDLVNNDWVGKSEVELNSSTVRAFLCSGAGCNNLTPNKQYSFARSGSANGGATFTTDGSGRGPGDSSAWNFTTHFGTTTYNFWTGRASSSATLWATTQDTNHCTNWTSNNAGINGRRGLSTSTTATRWTHGTLTACSDGTRRLICLVDYTQRVDATPDIFDFVDVTGAALSTQYQVSARVSGFVGPLSADVSGGDAAIRVNSTGSWGTTGVVVNPGDILNLQMTSSGSPSTGITATLTLGSLAVDWFVTTAVTEYNYFVLTSAGSTGNLGGISGGDSMCLGNLQANNWLGKSNVVLNSSTVRSWLCDGSTCNDLLPSKTYAFARSGSATDGGGTFTTDGSSQGPGFGNAWNIATRFGTTTYNVWTGRGVGTSSLWPTSSGATACTGWTTAALGTTGVGGATGSINTDRWSGTAAACNTSRRLLCAVDYTVPVDTTPDTFDFVDIDDAVASTLYETSVRVWGFVGPTTASVTGTGAEIRANDTGGWVTSGLTVIPGDLINVRLTSHATQAQSYTATVTVGAGTADWVVMTKPTFPMVIGGLASNDGDSTDHFIDLPAGQAGDLLIVFSSSHDDASPAPSGWSALVDLPHGGDDIKLTGFYKVADGTEGSSVQVVGGGFGGHYAYRIRYFSGVPEVTTATGTGTAANPPSLSPSWGADNTLWLAVFGANGSGTVSAYPTNYTNGQHSNGSWFRVSASRRDLNSASEDPAAFTNGNAPWMAVTVGIRPAP